MAPTHKIPALKWRPLLFCRCRLAMLVAAQCAGMLLLAASDIRAQSAISLERSDQQPRDLDWVPYSELTDEEKARVPAACCGAYIAPLRDDVDSELAPEKASIFGTADYSESEKQTKFIMRDNVRLTQGRRSFYADTFTFDKMSREAELDGNIQVREPGLLLRADGAYVDTQSGDARLDNARFVMYETRVRGRAESLEKFGDRIISLNNGTFTSCEPGDNTWLIEGSNITLHNDKHYGTARHMRLKVKDVPIAYAPYFRFPIGPDRLTGFLFPSVGLDEKDGIGELTVPFYWNIAPNYDATLTPRYLSDHGYMLITEFRHKSEYFDTELNASGLKNDRGGFSQRLQDQIETGEISEEQAYPYRGEDRWQFNLSQQGGRNQRWATGIDYTDVSDTDYIRDVDRSAVDINRQAYIRQSVGGSYRLNHWHVQGKLEEFRLLTDRQLPYRELPRVSAVGMYRVNDWVIELNNEYVNFDMNRYFRDAPNNAGSLGDLILGERARTDYSLYWDKQYAAGYLKPGIGVKTLSYRLNADNFDAQAKANQQFAAPQGTLDMGVFFEREKTLFATEFIQTLEPRAFYIYRDYEDQSSLYGLTTERSYVNFDTSDLIFTYRQLFRDSRFAGGDRIDDANHLALGVSSRLVETDSGVERLRVSLGQITYFEDRQVSILNQPDDYASTRSQSALAGELSAQFNQSLRMTSDVLYDHQLSQLNAVSASLQYMDNDYRIFNLGYRYNRDPVTLSPLDTTPTIGKTRNQLDVTALWPLNNQWAVIARSNYDFTYSAELDTFAGLEYTDCCYRVRLLARQWVDFDFSENFMETLNSDDYDRGVFVEVQLRGFGTLSQRISNLLDKAVYGFSEREASLQ